jgi:hypothetical protein
MVPAKPIYVSVPDRQNLILAPADKMKFCKRLFSRDPFTVVLEVTHWKVVILSNKAAFLLDSPD